MATYTKRRCKSCNIKGLRNRLFGNASAQLLTTPISRIPYRGRVPDSAGCTIVPTGAPGNAPIATV
jgi:hypothetical protein